jgi:hypothetical protein
MLALALLGFVLIAMALFALGVCYAAVLAADLSRLSILLMVIVHKIGRLKLAEREATRFRKGSALPSDQAVGADKERSRR